MAQAGSVTPSRESPKLVPRKLPPLVLASVQGWKAWDRCFAQQAQEVVKGEVEKDHRRTTARTSRNTIKKTSLKRRARLPRCRPLRGKSSRGSLNHSQMRESGRKASSYGPCSPEPLQPRLLETTSSRKTRTSKKPNQMDEEGPKHRAIPRAIRPKVQLASTKTRSKKWKRKTNPTHLERSSGQSLARPRRSQTAKVTSNPRLEVTDSRNKITVERNQESRQCGRLSPKRATAGRIAEAVNKVDSMIARKDRA